MECRRREHSKMASTSTKKLIKYLKFDDEGLTKKRKRYLQRRKEAIDSKKTDAAAYFKELLENEPERVIYIRAIVE